jgi:hypothetical protein
MRLYKRSKNTNIPVLKQIIDFVPHYIFQQSVKKHNSDKGCSKYKTFDQFVALSFGQLCKCYTLSDISCGLSVSQTFLKDIGLKQSPAKSTMSDGNRNRTWKVYETIYYKLLSHYTSQLKLKHQSHIIEEIKDKSIKLIDSTTISLCLSMFDWAKFRTAKGGLKIHTVWDDTLALPEYINITEAKTHDSKGLIDRVYSKDDIIVEDRGYFDFALMHARILSKNVFVTRIKDNTVYESIVEMELPDNEDQDILKDEIIVLTSKKAKDTGISEHKLRRIAVYKEDENKIIEIITNQLDWKARTIADLYKKRWNIELFFKAMKQNLQIKTFVGCSENAVKSQIYVSLINYLIIELIRRIYCKKATAFSNFCEKIRICLLHYLTLDYLCNIIKPHVNKVENQVLNILFPEDNLQNQLKLFT